MYQSSTEFFLMAAEQVYLITYICNGHQLDAKRQCVEDASATPVPSEDAQYVYEMLKGDFAQRWKEWTDA